MGTGEHYFVDLVVAFPFAVLIEAVCAFELPMRNGTRVAGFAMGLLATLAWLEALRYAPRFFWHSPWIPWILCAVTVAVSILCEIKLWNAAAVAAETRYPSFADAPSQAKIEAQC
jgi:hypothetical protein